MASVTELISVWALGGEASLNLATRNGITNVAFNCHLGHPGAPHSLPPSPTPPSPAFPPPRRPRHRGPAEKEKNRKRAAQHQAAMAKTAAPATSATSSSSSTASVISSSSHSSATEPVPTPMSTENLSKCNHCEETFKNDKCIRIHLGKSHKEQLRDEEEDKSLDLSLVNQAKDEKIYSPPLANSTILSGLEDAQASLCRTDYNCGGCEKIFYNEDDLTDHELNVHPLMCHMCFIFFKDKDEKVRHYAENHFKIHGALYAYLA